jgi:hypothetical protein
MVRTTTKNFKKTEKQDIGIHYILGIIKLSCISWLVVIFYRVYFIVTGGVFGT